MPALFVGNKPISYVVASLLSTVMVLQWQAIKVVRARIKAGVKYPRMYADTEAEMNSLPGRIFNCTQRAHQNTIENFPIIFTTTIITALKYPILAAVGCGTWSVFRIIYTLAYGGSGEPEKRIYPIRMILLIQLGMFAASAKTIVDLFMEGA